MPLVAWSDALPLPLPLLALLPLALLHLPLLPLPLLPLPLLPLPLVLVSGWVLVALFLSDAFPLLVLGAASFLSLPVPLSADWPEDEADPEDVLAEELAASALSAPLPWPWLARAAPVVPRLNIRTSSAATNGSRRSGPL